MDDVFSRMLRVSAEIEDEAFILGFTRTVRTVTPDKNIIISLGTPRKSEFKILVSSTLEPKVDSTIDFVLLPLTNGVKKVYTGSSYPYELAKSVVALCVEKSREAVGVSPLDLRDDFTGYEVLDSVVDTLKLMFRSLGAEVIVSLNSKNKTLVVIDSRYPTKEFINYDAFEHLMLLMQSLTGRLGQLEQINELSKVYGRTEVEKSKGLFFEDIERLRSM